MLITSEGIVLKQRKIAGNRRMLTVFTKNYGKISAGTSLNEKSKGKSALALRPFTYAEYDIFKGRESFSINNAQTIKSYYSIGEDLDRFLIASKLIEYLDMILEEGQARPKLFEMTLEFMESITRARGNYDTLLYAFIVKTLRVQGVMPELKCCVNCGKETMKTRYLFSVSDGGVICEDRERKIDDEHSLIYKPTFDIIDVLRYFIDKPLEQFEKVSLKPEVTDTIRKILGEYIDRYLGVGILKENMEISGSFGSQSIR